MSNEKKSWKVKYFGWVTAQRVIAICAVMALVISVFSFSGVRTEDIVRFVSTSLAREPDYYLTSLEQPRSLTLQCPLTIPTDYYYKVEINTREKFSSSETVQFSVETKNLGKKIAKSPLLRILIVDVFDQVRSEWSGNPTKQLLSFSYKVPPADQLTQGDWKIIALLYDSDIMIAYHAREFNLSAEGPVEIQALLFSTAGLAILTSMVFFLEKYRKRRRIATVKSIAER